MKSSLQSGTRLLFPKALLFLHLHIHQQAIVNIVGHDPSQLMVNTDGAARGNPGPAGAGGILRNDLSGFVKGFALKCGLCTSVKAELLGVLKGLVMAKDLNITNLILEVDSEVVVNAIIMEPEDCNPNYFLILQCRALINQDDWEVRIKHTYREANAVADWFANESFSCSNNVTYFDSPPTGVMSLLVDDVIGCSKPRMIVT